MALNSPHAFYGVGGNATFGGQSNISVKTWKFKASAEALNTTSTGDGGYKTSITGPVGGEGSFTANVDSSSNEFLGGLLTAGSQQTSCTLSLGSSPHSIGPMTCNITSWEVTNPAEETVTIEYNFVTTGSFTASSG